MHRDDHYVNSNQGSDSNHVHCPSFSFGGESNITLQNVEAAHLLRLVRYIRIGPAESGQTAVS